MRHHSTDRVIDQLTLSTDIYCFFLLTMIIFMTPLLVSLGCYNEVPQSELFKTTESYSLTVQGPEI